MGRPPVLLVDDDPAVQDVLTLFLSHAYEVKRAATGEEALAILQHEPIAAVLLDYRLPDRTGLDLLPDIRSARPGVPVIMMTGYGSEAVCASAFRLGVRDYFPKPLDIADLLCCLQQAVADASGHSPGPRAGAGHGLRRRPLAPSRAAGDLLIQKVVGLIQQRYWDHLSLSQLAGEVAMSKYRLSHRFRAAMGVTFRSYLLRVRLERAKELLSRTPATITEVALAVGFGDLPRFDKLFKRHTGLTPSAYRTAGGQASAQPA
jgi:YesN/AraC family two-component response regulator